MKSLTFALCIWALALHANFNQTLYFHTREITPAVLESVEHHDIIFEIDLCYAHTAFNEHVKAGESYIGHPATFYSEKNHTFPKDTLSVDEFIEYAVSHPKLRVFIDIKDPLSMSDLERIVTAVGAHRCIAHAFVTEWCFSPDKKAYWADEMVDLKPLDELLTRLKVPLIANCYAHSDAFVKEHDIISKMVSRAKECKSVIGLGLYYNVLSIPDLSILEKINRAGYLAWINGNDPKIGNIPASVRYIAMCDTPALCTRL